MKGGQICQVERIIASTGYKENLANKRPLHAANGQSCAAWSQKGHSVATLEALKCHAAQNSRWETIISDGPFKKLTCEKETTGVWVSERLLFDWVLHWWNGYSSDPCVRVWVICAVSYSADNGTGSDWFIGGLQWPLATVVVFFLEICGLKNLKEVEYTLHQCCRTIS